MIPESLIIEDKRRREERQWEPIPLHAPTPPPYRPEPSDYERRDGDTRSTVIIIDLSDYSEKRL